MILLGTSYITRRWPLSVNVQVQNENSVILYHDSTTLSLSCRLHEALHHIALQAAVVYSPILAALTELASGSFLQVSR